VTAAAGKNLKKSSLELGGSDAFIVLEDADIDKTVAWAVFGRHWNAGRVCVSAKRLIIADPVYDEFMDKYQSGVAALRAGDPREPGTQLAPLSTQKAADNLAAEVREAVEHGAYAETLGEPVPAQGAFFQPTILTGVTPDNPSFQTEFFGPVSMVFRVAGEDEAVALANASRYGLGGSVFTRDTARGERVARRIETGMVFVNHPTMVKSDIPFGGVKVSGYGNELTEFGIREFVTNKVIDVVDIDGRSDPRHRTRHDAGPPAQRQAARACGLPRKPGGACGRTAPHADVALLRASGLVTSSVRHSGPQSGAVS
jgi:succinate-semialdehyde dehydrogenase/glutarate-semialdehyde dehydrogenase